MTCLKLNVFSSQKHFVSILSGGPNVSLSQSQEEEKGNELEVCALFTRPATVSTTISTKFYKCDGKISGDKKRGHYSRLDI